MKSAALAVMVALVWLAPLSGTVARAQRSAMSGPGGGGVFDGLEFAQEGGPVSIKADSLEVDYASDRLTYRGNVVVRQNDVILKSDRLDLVYKVDDRDPIVKAEASGRVSIQKGESKAVGGRAVYDRQTKTIVLSEDPMLLQGPNRIGGEKIKVYLAEGRSVVEGGRGRVRAVLYPGSEKAGER